ncbi:MAG: hypothetical protein BEN19_00995 [Epulopiscium sp. Nuni2H_MBin003]|nr:MAG: hypothetical protein BEN19_00995 [Epulopiscium sp. Nuni2H_MBin003]
MKLNQYIFTLIIFGAVLVGKVDTYASIDFTHDEYVRITHPVTDYDEDYILTTFEEHINIMGEAKVGTNITISVVQEQVLYKEYILGEVGATQTFNQLIELGEKDNQIVLEYTTIEKEIGVIVVDIYRQPEEHKLKIKNYIVSTPSDLPDNLVEKTTDTGIQIIMIGK